MTNAVWQRPLPSRIDSLQAPARAGRGPLLGFLFVLALVLAVVLVAAFENGWLYALLVPVAAFSLFVLVQVARVLLASRSSEE